MIKLILVAAVFIMIFLLLINIGRLDFYISEKIRELEDK